MKVDVEGMELEVLRGAAQTIQRCKPALFVENDRDEKSAALISYHLQSWLPAVVASHAALPPG